MPDKLFEYGIQTEKTTHRIHVDINGYVIIYKTECGIDAMPEPIHVSSYDEWEISGYYLLTQPNMPPGYGAFATARGVRVPYAMILNCRGVRIPPHIIPDIKRDTGAKGREAIRIVAKMFEEGRIPLQCTIKEINKISDQILGRDIDIGESVIQVKHDFGCFSRGLFMQTHEWNPRGIV